MCYLDSTVALPLLASHALGTTARRPLKRLYDRRGELMDRLRAEYRSASDAPVVAEATETVLDRHR